MSVLDYAIPPILQLEPTTACNLGCPSCLRPVFSRSDESLSFETFTRIVGSSKNRYLTLHGWGEPLMNPDLIRMVRYAAERGKSVNFTTNATLAGNAADALIGSGLSAIAFSMPDTARCTERIAGNIRTFVRRKKELGAALPKTYLNVVLLEENLGQVEDVLSLARDFGVDVVSFERAFPWTPVLQAAEPLLFRNIRNTAREVGCEVKLPPGHTVPCPLMRYTIFVRHNGDVAPCCYRADTRLGNLLADSPLAILQARARFLKAQRTDPVCSACRT